MPRKLLFSVSIKDCKVETFTCGGKGGSGKDTSNNGVRVRHEPSGAVGEARDSRNQLQNKRAAFKRMASTPGFRSWCRLQACRLNTGKSIDELVDADLAAHLLKVERKTPLGWEVWHEPDDVERFFDDMQARKKAYILRNYGTPEAPTYPHHADTICARCHTWPKSAKANHQALCLRCWHQDIDSIAF